MSQLRNFMSKSGLCLDVYEKISVISCLLCVWSLLFRWAWLLRCVCFRGVCVGSTWRLCGEGQSSYIVRCMISQCPAAVARFAAYCGMIKTPIIHRVLSIKKQSVKKKYA